MTRRGFLLYTAAGAASCPLLGCAGASRRGTDSGDRNARPGSPRREPVDRDTFRCLADAALTASNADHTVVSLRDRTGGWTRFRDGLVESRTCPPGWRILVVAAFGQQEGGGVATELTTDAVVAAVRAAEQEAKAAEPNLDCLPPLPPQQYPVLPTFRPETAAAHAARRAAEVSEIERLCAGENLRASGAVGTSAEAVGVAADTGLFAFERRTMAEFELHLSAAGSLGRSLAANVARSIDDLEVLRRARRAVRRAHSLMTRRALPAEPFSVILAPKAVAQLLRPLLDATDARAYHAQGGALHGRLGERIVDARLSLRNRPDHPYLLGVGFDAGGLPSNAATWIERGVLERIRYDRLAARAYQTSPTYSPEAWHFSGADAEGERVSDLVAQTGRGLLVTDLGDPLCDDAGTLTLAGTTRDGLFLVEDGRIVSGVADLAWRESPLRVFTRVRAFTTPLGATLPEHGSPGQLTSPTRKLLVPAMTLSDFGFSGGASS